MTSIVLGVIGFGYTRKRKYVLPSINLSSVKGILAISMPTIRHVPGIILTGFNDRLFIDWLAGTSTVGRYDVGYKIGMITMFVSDAFMRTRFPWFFENISTNGEDTRLTIISRSYLFTIGLLFPAVLVTAGSHLVLPILLDKAFSGAGMFVMWIALAYASRYLKPAGGYTRRANERQTRLVRANGEVTPCRGIQKNNLELGAIIVVPTKNRKRNYFMKSFSEAPGIVTGVLATALLISKL